MKTTMTELNDLNLEQISAGGQKGPVVTPIVKDQQLRRARQAAAQKGATSAAC